MGSGGFLADGALDAELTALRARAYGVDADIDADPVAAARLAELEELHAASLARAVHESAARGAEPAARAIETGAPDDGAPRDRSWWYRGRTGAFLAGIAVAAAAAAAVAAWMLWTGPRPDATLRPTGVAPSEQVLRLTDHARRQMVSKTTLRGFEPILGLEVWEAQSGLGNSCLLVFEPATDDLLAVGCVPPPANPGVEIYDVPVAWTQEWTERFPTGTVVRFVLTEDAVDVWILEGTS
ncbi:hypothetical protein Q9R08_06025 [Microbacterium sp. QXD-8]|uniref:Anti-sigma factor n=1 Tax=Microbacterium psychrotolerans TaxID=3068321 RepID=A0ABU0Z114_9MICO|nr:hypothetical protein [Microbacterium sp. QXD-8]MDQ7877529.1 hypothetical protein [Microbacterium sp. QXD-8]